MIAMTCRQKMIGGPPPGQPMAHDITSRHLNGRGAGVGGERPREREPGDAPDPGQDLPAVRYPAQLDQGAVAGRDDGGYDGGATCSPQVRTAVGPREPLLFGRCCRNCRRPRSRLCA